MEVLMYRAPSGRSPLEEWIEKLSVADRARFAEVADGIERHGFGCPRVAYVVISRDRMVWLHAFKKKRQRTPHGDLQVALRRMKEVLGR